MNDNFEKSMKKTNGKKTKFELIVGIWTVAVIVLLVGSVSFALVKLNQTGNKQNNQVANTISSSAVQNEPAPVSEAAVTSGSSVEPDVVDTTDLYKNKYAYTGTVVNVRSEPSTISRIVVKLKVGTKVQLSKKYDDSWAEIIYNGEKCYIMSQYLSPTAPVGSDSNNVVAPTPTSTPKNQSVPKKTPKPSPSPTASSKPKQSAKPTNTASPSPSSSTTTPTPTPPSDNPPNSPSGNGNQGGSSSSESGSSNSGNTTNNNTSPTN